VSPDADLFTALSAGTASIVTDRIETFTERGWHWPAAPDWRPT
jgi:hypothetical protein